MLHTTFKDFNSEYADLAKTFSKISQLRYENTRESVSEAVTLLKNAIETLKKYSYQKWDEDASRLIIQTIYACVCAAAEHNIMKDFYFLIENLNEIYYASPQGTRENPLTIYMVANAQGNYISYKFPPEKNYKRYLVKLKMLDRECKNYQNMCNLVYEYKEQILQLPLPNQAELIDLEFYRVASICVLIGEYEPALKFLKCHLESTLAMAVIEPDSYHNFSAQLSVFAVAFDFDHEYKLLFSFAASLFDINNTVTKNDAVFSDFSAICFTFKNNITPANSEKLSFLLQLINLIDKLANLGAFTKDAEGNYRYPFHDCEFREKMSLPGYQARFQEWKNVFTKNHVDLMNLNSHPQLVIAQHLEIQKLKRQLDKLQQTFAILQDMHSKPKAAKPKADEERKPQRLFSSPGRIKY